MTRLQVFDKPLCCSSGVCGTNVDPALVKLSADLRWLELQAVQVQRFNPAHQPGLFATNELVREELKRHGNNCLPLILVNDVIVSRGVVPSRHQLASWTGITFSSFPELPVMNNGCCGDTQDTTGASHSCC